MLLTDLLDFSFEQYGEYPFLYFNDTTYTNKETSVFSKKISVLLRNLGICDGERVMVSLPNCPEVIFSYQGILRAKNVVVPVMFLLHPSEIHFILNDCKAKAIVTSSLVLPKLVEAAKNLPYEPIFIVVDHIPNIKDYENVDIVELHKAIELINEDEEAAMHASESDLAVILYTSGTTGRPKGVMLTHKNLYSSARTSYEMSIENGDYEPSTTIGVLPLAHIYGFTTMNTNFLLGNSVDIFPTFDVEKLFQSIEKYKVKNIGLVPAMIHAMVFAPQSNKYDLSSLESVISGSASLPVAIIQAFKKKFNAEIREGYGLSEAAPVVSSHRDGIPIKYGSVGIPIPGIEVKVVDHNGNDVQRGEVGELLVKGDNITLGYYGLEEETKNTIKDGWLYTGDLVKMDEDDYLYIVDRKKDLIIRGGFNVYPRDLEEVIAAHEAVSEAAVIGIPDEKMGEEIIACVILKPGSVVTEEDIIAYTQQKFAKYKTPKRVFFLDELPRTSIGKILKRKLRDLYENANMTKS